MRLALRVGGETYAVDLEREADGRWRVQAAGTTLTAAAAGEAVYLEVDGRPLAAVVVRDGRRLWVAAGGEIAVVEEAAEADAAGPGAPGESTVTAPMPGRVGKVLVAAGDRVAAGQVVATVEAMKMEHALRAAGAGRVAEVCVAPGDRVEPGQVLMTLAADDQLKNVSGKLQERRR